MKRDEISLDDKYALTAGRVFLNGTQALARLPMLQRERDVAAGLNTAGFISGYRGSPLGGLDQTLWKARAHLEAHHIRFQPGINEDLAATAVWGTQQVNLYPGAKYDGVFALWYGKGPGVDRCGDVFRHANAAGTSRHGGVLVVAGDDHAARSSTLPHQTDHIFKSVMMPLLVPSGVQEYLDLGLHGWALSRYSGCWVAFKAVSETVESSASTDVDPWRVRIALPKDFVMPPGGLNIRWPDPPPVQEERLLHHKLYAALAYCRANGLNRIVIDSPAPRLGIITAGKSYLDVRQALDDLGIDEELAAQIGIRLYKVAMVWPLEAEGVRRFAEGLDEILVVEEKRQLLEYQLKEELYNWREDVRPRVVGKFDEKGEWALPHGDWLLPAASELTPTLIARAIAGRVDRFFTSPRIRERLAFLEAKDRALATPTPAIQRIPYFCPGCPHNVSTNVPEGSRALAGIGCHYMAIWMDRSTSTFSHMGGEGVAWVGQAPFTETRHVFANLGDGTYFHSGILAIRQAVAAKVPITYKILYNDAVAMTGGQPVDGVLSVPRITRQLAAEGVERIVIVTDQPEKYRAAQGLAPGVPVRHRDELDAVQRELRDFRGVSALIYDQTCAAEKRRRRKRGQYPDPARRVFINELVCEGCGDCGVKSNCLAVAPVETEFGRKRAIDQSACNKDFSCLKGFCPSFVSVEGGRLRAAQPGTTTGSALPEPPRPSLPDTTRPWGVLITGVGGSGVITVGALIGMAAHIDGKGVTVLDMTGLAQKGGAVFSHVRIADRPEDIHAVRIAAGEADCVIGGDVVVTASAEALSKMRSGSTRAVVNRAIAPTAAFTRDPDWCFPLESMESAIGEAASSADCDVIDATRLATALLGDAVATNLFLVGYAWQKGWLPVSLESLDRAIELNGVAVTMNRQALRWGRCAAHDLPAVEACAAPPNDGPAASLSTTLDELIARRSAFLAGYQDRRYAARYEALVAAAAHAEAALFGMETGTLRKLSLINRTGAAGRLTEAVVRNYFKLLAYKDEYEVARLLGAPEFRQQIGAVFEGDFAIRYHLAPPSLSWPTGDAAEPAKWAIGPIIEPLFRLLAQLKFLRGTPFDPFGRGPERVEERRLIAQYEKDIADILAGLGHENHTLATEIAALPEQIRGYGHLKAATIASVQKTREVLKARLGRSQPAAPETIA
jgi:indolepyruvate ferredoxin oxidoreductase